MAVGIQLGRREASTFSRDRAAPFSGRLGKPSLPGRVFRETGRDGRSAPSASVGSIHIPHCTIPMLLCIQLGRREASTFSRDRAAPFSGRLGKPSLPGRVFRETGRDGRSAPSVLWDRFIYRTALSRCFYVSSLEGGKVPLSPWIEPHPFPDGLEPERSGDSQRQSHPCLVGLNPVPFGSFPLLVCSLRRVAFSDQEAEIRVRGC
jgi:hypothetical protein